MTQPQKTVLAGFERNVLAASGAAFLMFFGEELWKKFLPRYLESLGASVVVIGLFGTAKDFFDAVYQYPGGWLADRIGRRRAFLVFIAIASIGYLIYLVSPSWPFMFLGLGLVMAWSSMASPAIFAVIGDALPKGQRVRGFTVQAFLRRIPMAAGPLVGGLLIASLGLSLGVKTGLVATLVAAVLTVFVVRAVNVRVAAGGRVNILGVWRSFDPTLKRLLVSDAIIRTCEGLAEVFVVLYVMNILGMTAAQYGVLVALQMVTSMLAYLPFGALADKFGRKPFVIATFGFFAAFPVSVVLASGFVSLVVAFIVGGLRELGEPSRKAMIVDMAEPHVRARTVGLYYLIRSLIITPASAIGGLLWRAAPETPFILAGVIGAIGVLVFAVTVREHPADTR